MQRERDDKNPDCPKHHLTVRWSLPALDRLRTRQCHGWGSWPLSGAEAPAESGASVPARSVSVWVFPRAGLPGQDPPTPGSGPWNGGAMGTAPFSLTPLKCFLLFPSQVTILESGLGGWGAGEVLGLWEAEERVRRREAQDRARMGVPLPRQVHPLFLQQPSAKNRGLRLSVVWHPQETAGLGVEHWPRSLGSTGGL